MNKVLEDKIETCARLVLMNSSGVNFHKVMIEVLSEELNERAAIAIKSVFETTSFKDLVDVMNSSQKYVAEVEKFNAEVNAENAKNKKKNGKPKL